MKAAGSWAMLCSLISAGDFSVCTVEGTTDGDVFCIHEWLMMSSRDGRSAGLRHKHHLISCWHSAGREREGELVRRPSAKTRASVAEARALTCGDLPPEQNLCLGDLLIVFKRDVSTHHVVQQDAQGPNGG